MPKDVSAPAPPDVAALPVLERRCLAVLATVGRPLTRTGIAEHLRTAGVRHAAPAEAPRPNKPTPLGQVVSTTDLSPMVKRWQQRRLAVHLEHLSGEHYLCTAEATHAVLTDPECRVTLEALRRAWTPSPHDRNGYHQYHHGYDMLERSVRLTRIALYLGEPAEADRTFVQVMKAYESGYAREDVDPHELLLHPRTPAAALSRMSPALRDAWLVHVTRRCLGLGLLPSQSMLAAMLEVEPARGPEVRARAVMLATLAGVDVDADALLAADDSTLAIEARALAALRRGDFEASRALVKHAIERPTGKRGRKTPALRSPLSPLLVLGLATGEPSQVALARSYFNQVAQGRSVDGAHRSLAALLGERMPLKIAAWQDGLAAWIEQLCAALVLVFLGEPVPTNTRRQLEGTRKTLETRGLAWLAAQIESAERALRKPPEPASDSARTRGAVLLDLHQVQAPWERALALLESLQPRSESRAPSAATDKTAPDRRLTFAISLRDHRALPARGYFPGEVDEDDPELLAAIEEEIDDLEDLEGTDAIVARLRAERDGIAARQTPRITSPEPDAPLERTLYIEPRLQVRRGQGFTVGRPVALRTLANGGSELDYLTAEDRRVIGRINVRRNWQGTEHYFSALAPMALVGHPRVFWQHDLAGAAVQVISQPPTLRVVRGKGGGLSLRVEPHANAAGVAMAVDGEGRLVVSELTPAQVSVQRAALDLPPIPAKGEPRLRQILGRMAPLFTIQSQVGVDSADGGVEMIAADGRCVVQLVRAEPGLRARVSVAPLGLTGPSFKPGEGLETVVAKVDGRRVSCKRELRAERAELSALLAAVPVLQGALGAAPVQLETLEDCLALLSGLSALGDAVVVHWPEGEPLTVVGEAELSSLRLTLGERGEWLQATGTLQVDEARVLDLLPLLAQRTSSGRYVALGEGRYLALSEELAQQLGALDAAATGTGREKRGEALRLSPLALGFVSPWLKALRAVGGLALDARTKAQLDRIERAFETTPELPRTLDAELRAYQRSGYEFLARLGEIGAGACLADDMGLGKTVMTLAALLSRAGSGPALVVTPTSVRTNWFDEALRFAPSLRMRRLEGAEGVEAEGLEPFDVLVCSYTVMAQRIEQLERVRFATLVLDEAQAIKNQTTQRAKAARRVVADARIALTGTPVENHLGDLHGIMSVLNPGLLGDAQRFEARFAKPIQRDGDLEARERLRALIAPFVLRRRKAEVLRELPARTEITLRVEPEPAEQAFTEALRRAALLRLSDATRAGSAISILAEITRLRRAACHPRLVDPKADVGGAKLERLVELAHELRDGGHRALVFSQFVDFLHIVRDRLTAEGFSQQYLDGSCSEPQRKKAVSAFQAGEGDVFLISLKAGGFGLNLTAADYVIHLDPWWNPAVEAQASDRAHRIGQERPVTIYRLVNAASIEERVLSLHARKQALAEELLRDSGEVTRLDPRALLALLEDGAS